MFNSESKPPTMDYILKRISDGKALNLFNGIAGKPILLRKFDLTSKQYYGRISGLMNAGLIKRDNSRYSLMTLGKVVYDLHMIIGKALSYYSRLKAIESIEMSYGAAFRKERIGYYDLVILDIKMPKMDGFQLYDEIKKKDHKAKVCFLTASELYYQEFRRREYDAIDKNLSDSLEGSFSFSLISPSSSFV